MTTVRTPQTTAQQTGVSLTARPDSIAAGTGMDAVTLLVEDLDLQTRYYHAALAGLGLGLVSLAWNPMAVLGIAGLALSLLGKRRVTTWVRENYRPTGGRIATWGLVSAGISTTLTLLVQGFFR